MSAVNQLDVSALVEMGFTRERVTEALKATKNQGLPPALEWLFSHPIADASSGGHTLGGGETNSEDTSDNTNVTETTENIQTEPEKEEPMQESPPPQQASSLKCEDCGKLIRSELDAQSHAARTGHQNFSESTEEIKPLTTEEKLAQKERLQQKLEERRKQRVVTEKQEELAREKSRRRTGKEITQAKEDQALQEMKRIAEERRREKLEEKLIRKRLKEEIAKDRAAMKNKTSASTSLSSSHQPSTSSPSSNATAVDTKKKEYDTCRIQFRLANGKSVNETFKAMDTLQNVHLYIAEHDANLLQPFSLSTTFPRKTFQTSDMNKTLKELKLVPSAVLVLGKI